MLISSHEGGHETLLGLKLFAGMRLDKGATIPVAWILDCQYGGRDAVTRLFEWLNEMFKWTEQRFPKVATCHFHQTAAIRLRKSEIPNFDQFSHELRLLAETPPELFDAVSAALCKEWCSRAESLTFMEDYFIPTWMKQYPGWNVAFLGPGATRVSHESSWPSFHRLLGGKKLSPINMIAAVIASVIPYFVASVTSARNLRRPLDTRRRQAAVQLAMEGSQKLKSRMIDGTEIFFTRRRLLHTGRPFITANDITEFLKILARLEDNEVTLLNISPILLYMNE